MTPIADLATGLLAQPGVVFFVDTCSFLDLFRRDDSKQPRVPPGEIQSATEFLRLLMTQPQAGRLIVPELVPGEYADHANRIQNVFESWLRFHDQNQNWLFEAGAWLNLALPTPVAVHQFDVHDKCRQLADDLLAHAQVIARDQGCLDRALARLINKRRPSHKKEIKDSMNLEQCLELSRQLQIAGFSAKRVFVSSNTSDFADTTNSKLHPDLQGEFDAAGLEYFASLNVALGSLRARGHLP